MTSFDSFKIINFKILFIKNLNRAKLFMNANIFRKIYNKKVDTHLIEKTQ